MKESFFLVEYKLRVHLFLGKCALISSGIPSERLPFMLSAAVAADCTYQEEHSEEHQCSDLFTPLQSCV